MQVLGRDGGCGSAADDVLALLGEEQGHHAVVVVPVGGRAEEQIHGYPLADPNHAGGGIVAGLVVVQPVALVHQNGGKGLGRITGGSLRLHIGDNILPLPAEVVGGADARVWASVAHEDENIALL